MRQRARPSRRAALLRAQEHGARLGADDERTPQGHSVEDLRLQARLRLGAATEVVRRAERHDTGARAAPPVAPTPWFENANAARSRRGEHCVARRAARRARRVVRRRQERYAVRGDRERWKPRRDYRRGGGGAERSWPLRALRSACAQGEEEEKGGGRAGA